MSVPPETAWQIDKALADWLAQRAGPDGPRHEAAFQAWLRAKPEHRNAYDAFVEIDHRVAQTSLVIPSLHIAKASNRFSRRSYAMAAAAAAFIILIGGFIGLRYDGSWRSPQSIDYASNGDPRAVDLGDGTVAILDANSLIRTSLMVPKSEARLLRGRVRFGVGGKPDAAPFTVSAGDLRLGLRSGVFDIRLGAQTVTIDNLRGNLVVRRQSARAGAPAMPIAQGERLEMVADRTITMKTPKGNTDWTADMLPLDGRTLGELVAIINRTSHVHIRLADPSLARLELQGQLPGVETGALARQLAAACDLMVSKDADGFLLSRKSAP